MGRWTAVLGLALVCVAADASQPRKGTALLEVDLRAGKKTRIDAAQGGDALDAEMDAVLGRAGAKNQSFTTKELELIEEKMVANLRRERPRATPHLIVFVYPGRVSPEKLKLLSEVFVDIEILIDPCERSLCRDAVARHIEMVGQAVQKAEVKTARWTLVYKQLILRTATRFRDTEGDEFRVPISDCIAAGRRAGGGRAWLDSMGHSVAQYEPLVAKAIQRHAGRFRVALAGPPRVSRQGGEADAVVRIKADRNRLQTQVIDAMAATAQAFRDNQATPATTHIEVHAEVPMKGVKVRRFRCLGQPVLALLDKQIDAAMLWNTYVRETTPQAGVQTVSFDDDDGGGRRGGGGEANDADAIAVLTQSFAALRDCARAEASKNPRFGGVTMSFRWLPSGGTDNLTLKDGAGRAGPLKGCLGAALGSMRFPKFDGTPRQIDFPIRVKQR
ncbi:MAG TPA: hypothetical protein VGQ83_42450 [Polyangia bacterium]|jgi:hypothetical protein